MEFQWPAPPLHGSCCTTSTSHRALEDIAVVAEVLSKKIMMIHYDVLSKKILVILKLVDIAVAGDVVSRKELNLHCNHDQKLRKPN